MPSSRLAYVEGSKGEPQHRRGGGEHMLRSSVFADTPPRAVRSTSIANAHVTQITFSFLFRIPFPAGLPTAFRFHSLFFILMSAAAAVPGVISSSVALAVRSCFSAVLPVATSFTPDKHRAKMDKLFTIVCREVNAFNKRFPDRPGRGQGAASGAEGDGEDCDTIVTQQRQLLRDFFIAMPAHVAATLPGTLVSAHDDVLQAELQRDAALVVDGMTLPTLVPTLACPISPAGYDVCVWQGDMSKLKCDAVVNPGNNALLGCFLPTHKCLDNILHAQSGIRLRIACDQMLRKLNIDEDVNGMCRPTPAYNLPSSHVFHTVGPCLVTGHGRHAFTRLPSISDRAELRSCYVACLEEAWKMGLSSIAFCCISTGIFGYPQDEAVGVACGAVRDFFEGRAISSLPPPATGSATPFRVIFNVFLDADRDLYLTKAPAQFGAAPVAAAP